jgi:hypothetical protein
MHRHIDGAEMLGFEPTDDSIARLNASDGVIEQTLGDLFLYYDSRAPVTLPWLAKRLGGSYGPPSSESFCDTALAVSAAMLARASADVLEPHLYIGKGDARYDEAGKGQAGPRVLGIYDCKPTAFPRIEYTKFPHKVPRVSKHVVRQARVANVKESDRHLANGREYRVDPHVLVRYLNGIHNVLSPKYMRDRTALELVWKASERTVDYKLIKIGAQHLDESRLVADRVIHETVAVAAAFMSDGNVDCDVAAQQELHRAVAARLYRAESDDRLASGWHELAGMALRYVEAKQEIVECARAATVAALAKYVTAIPVGYTMSVDQR